MAGKIRVGVIGASATGGWPSTSHFPAIAGLDNFELSAVATTRQESADAVAAKYGATHAFVGAKSLVESDDVDVVTITVNIRNHAEITKLALAAGKHVYTEWPFAINGAETAELADLGAAAGVKHVVGLQGRSAAMVNYVRDLVAEGFVGTVRSASVRIGRSLVFGAVTPENKWASDRSYGSNRFTIGAGHAFDDVRYMLGEFVDVAGLVAAQVKSAPVVGTDEVIEVTAPDNVLVTARLENEILLSFAMLSAMSSGIRFEVHGDDGELVVTGPSSLHLSPVGLSLTGAKGTDAPEPMPVPASYRPAPESVPDGSAVNVAGLYTMLATAIEDDAPTDPSFETARSLYEILDAIDTASETGQRQTITV